MKKTTLHLRENGQYNFISKDGRPITARRDFPENQDYDWTSFWKNNPKPPIVYHGTNSLYEKRLLREGLCPGKTLGLRRIATTKELIEILDELGLPNVEGFGLRHDIDMSLVNHDTDKLSLSFDPIVAASYSLNAPESLGTLYNLYKGILKRATELGVSEDNIGLRKLVLKTKKLEDFKQRLRRFMPMVLGIQTNLEKFHGLPEGFVSDKTFQEARHEFGRVAMTGMDGNHFRGYLSTSEKIKPEEIVSITYLDLGDRLK